MPWRTRWTSRGSWLRAKVAELEGKTSAELTEEQHAKLAAEREAVFQSIVARIQFPSLNPPRTFTELFSHFFFPVFQNAAARREGEWGALTANHKITLIKMVREYTGVGLKEAKEFVEGATTRAVGHPGRHEGGGLDARDARAARLDQNVV